MKTIKFESNYASFAYRLTATIEPDMFRAFQHIDSTSSPEERASDKAEKAMMSAVEELLLQGLANIAYRVAGSRIDKALGVKSKKNGGMGREGVVFDPKHIPTIESAVSTAITEMENVEGSKVKPLALSFAITGEYVPKTDGTASKEATELWTKVQALPADKFEAAIKKLGLAEDYDDESGIAACVRHIQAEKAKAKLAAAAGLGV